MIVRMGLVLAVVLTSANAQAQKPKADSKVLPAAEAKNHLNSNATVEMTVQRSRNAEKYMSYYLDSESEINDENNLAIVIQHKHAKAFKAAGIDDPAEHYRDKTIRVTGKIVKEGKQIRIRVESPRAIKIVEPK